MSITKKSRLNKDTQGQNNVEKKTGNTHRKEASCVNKSEGTLCSFGDEIQTQNFYIYNINGAIIQHERSLFFQEVSKQAVLRG